MKKISLLFMTMMMTFLTAVTARADMIVDYDAIIKEALITRLLPRVLILIVIIIVVVLIIRRIRK